MRQAIAEELHRPARRNFLTRRVELKGIDDLYQADLVEMLPYARENRGYKYILTMINCFSKYAYAVPLKSKTAVEVASALQKVLKSLPNLPRHLQVDQGKEWYNAKVQNLLRENNNINLYSTFSEKKASIVERFNRTLKEKMWRQFTSQGSYKWLKMLPLLIETYNNTIHRTIRMKPNEVNKRNENKVLRAINSATFRKNTMKKSKFKVGDRVRINKYKKHFSKGYLPNWSNEIFIVSSVQPTRPITYLLKDERGELIKGSFYGEELNKTSLANVYLVEKVLRRKGDKVLVRWLGFDSSHDSWIDKKDII